MGQTYSGNPESSDRDKVRFLARDTTSGAMTLNDEEVDWLLTQEANVFMAAAAAVELIANRHVGIASKSVGGLSLSYSQASASEYARTLRLRGRSYQVPTAGGISIAANEIDATDTDRPTPDFRRGMHDHPSS